MKILYLDIETTGLDPEKDQVIELGMVVDDLYKREPLEQLPRCRAFVIHERYTGDPFALSMNVAILKGIAKKEWPMWDGTSTLRTGQLVLADNLINYAEQFLIDAWGEESPVQCGGKNVGSFDLQFLKKLRGFRANRIGAFKLNHRFLDPGNLYLDLDKDFYLPGTEECAKRAGIEMVDDHYVLGPELKVSPHTSVGDCLLVAELVRRRFP